MGDERSADRSTNVMSICILTVLAAVALVAGYIHYQNYRQKLSRDVESGLSAIVKLKAGELERWRQDRLEHGAIISSVEALSILVRRAFVEGADPESRRQLQEWLATYRNSYHYDQVRLLDAEGRSRLSLPAEQLPVPDAVKSRVADVVRSGQVTMVDFYRDEQDKRVYLTMLIPVTSKRPQNRVIAVVALRVDPEKYLYPLVQFWPTSARTAETLLVRREGDQALFLNDLKFKKDSKLNLRTPLSNVNQPAVKAVLGGAGFVEGTDYRGIPVEAYLHPVAGTPWFLVARIDKEEVFAPLNERLWWMVGTGTLLVLSTGIGFGFFMRQQRVSFYRTRYRIERERAWLQGVIARSLNEIYVFDPKTLRFVFVNDGALLNIGYSMAELTELRAFDLKPEYSENAFRALLQPLLDRETERLVFKTVHGRKNGSTYPVEVYLQLMETDDGPVFLAVVNDITERERIDAEIRQKNAELERFTYTVSHDLKSPLITIKSFSGSIMRDLSTARYDRIAKDLERIGNAADKMAALLDDLLELSRIGRVVNAAEPLAMEELVRGVIKNLAGILDINNIRIDVQPGLPTVLCDRQRLAEVVQNLLENAVKYIGEQPHPQILFGARKEGDRDVFFVQDNGIGIEPDFHQNIFGLFNKLDAKSSGTGIGLALVKRIVEVHGGEVWVESEGVGRGSRFCFTLAG